MKPKMETVVNQVENSEGYSWWQTLRWI